MRVIKRNGIYQNVQFDKITKRINHLAYNLKVDPVLVAQKVCGQLIDGIQTSMLDEISAQICMAMYSIHPDYNVLGSRILIDNHIKNTPTSLVEVVSNLEHILSPEYVELVKTNYDKYDDMIDYERDFLIDYFGMKTLMKSYLLKKDNVIIERPQHLWMRVAIFLHKDDFDAVKETYDWLSTKHFTHASPTLYNSGTKSPQLSSCFVQGTLVDTVNKGPIPIENVVQGDTVITHLGNVKEVVQCHINKLNGRKLYKVNLYNTRPFTVTHDHKLWTYNSNTLKLKWTRVEDLLDTDFVSLPLYNLKANNVKFNIKPCITKYIYTDKRIIDVGNWKQFEQQSNYFLSEFDLNDELMWLFGILVRHCKVNYQLDDLNTITGISIFCLNEKIRGLIEKYFQVTVNQTEYTFTIDNVYLGIFCEYLSNRLPVEFYSLSNEFVHNFIKGFCFNSTSDEIDIGMCNTLMVQDIYTLCRLHNICANVVDTKFTIDRYYNGLYNDNEVISKLNTDLRNVNGTTFVKFCNKELIPSENINVYTLGVEDDHSYSISGIIAKNCFLTTVEDSIEGIFKTLTDCAQISKWAGGIGVNISDIRGKNSVIRGTNGVTQGIVPLLKTYNATCRYVNQCFVGSTIVYTNNGPKAIKNVIPESDFVLTSDGTYKQVFEKFENPVDKKILKIKGVYTLESIKCTNEHELYVSKDEGETFNYIPAKELCINDLMAFPIPIEVQDYNSIDIDVCRLYGIILARGYYKDNWYYLVVPKKYSETIEFIEKYYPNYNETDTTIVFRFKLLDIMKHEWIYPYDKTKAIHPLFLNLPNDKLIHVLHGLFETKYTHNNRYLYFINSNRMLIESIRYAFLKFKTLTFGNKLVKSNAYYIKIPIHHLLKELTTILGIEKCTFEDEHILWIEKNGHLLSRIKSIDSINYKGFVYDLQIDHNHNYTTHMGLVHNSGKRLGSFAMYIEPWHSDVLDFLSAKKNQGAEEERARDLFYALWIPDLFMERVEKDEMWSLMCPDTSRGLTEVYGDEFRELYQKYENEGKYVRQLRARQVWDAIIESQIETGVPYMLYKDAVNRKSPQENIGVIKQSNLCTEIVLYTDKEHVSVCNLASIALPSYINMETLEFDFEKLEKVTRVITRNLNKVIDLNYYPVKEAKSTNLKHRPIGIGVQGMADVFAIMKWPFDSDKSRHLNKCIFECIYYSAISESCKLSEKYGPYALFTGSPMSKGILQFDMWDKEYKHPSDRYDWEQLKQDVMKFGLRNSTVLAPMPTASTSQILGFNECLVEGTQITDVHGISHPIESIDPDENILSLNENINKLVIDRVVEKIDKDVKPTRKIQLIDGREIECTSEHKFRVCNNKTMTYEWKEAHELTRDDSLVMGINGIQNVYSQFPFDISYFDNYLTNPTKEKCCALARLLGFILADGNYIDCEKTIVRLETLYDLQLLIHDLDILDDSKTYIITDNNINITLEIGKPITNILCKILANCKEPDMNIDHSLSTMSNNDILIPELLLNEECPKIIIREFLAGYLGGDGFSPFLKMKEENKSKMVGCNIVRAISHFDYNKMAKFMQNIKLLFNRIGIITSIKTKEYIHNNSHIVVFNVKMLNISDFVNKVGFRYNIHKILRNDIYQLVLNYKNKIVQQRNYIVSKVFELYNTEKCVDKIYNSAIQMYDGIFLHEESIPSLEHVKMCLKYKSIIDIDIEIDKEKLFKDIGVEEWFIRNNTIVEKTKLCLPVYHVPFLNSFENGEKRVYDINTLETHTFIANGIVVHNCIEPFTSNLYLRRTLAGEFTCINKYLIKDLHELGLWSKDLMEKLIYYKGSVQYIKEIPQHIKDIYKTVWEVKQRSLIEMAADRGVYICQSQSLNLFFENPNYSKLTSAHFLGWKLGLKTGSYYIRSQSAIDAQNFTIDPEKEKQLEQEKLEQQVVICPMRPKGASNYEPCEACSG